MSWILVIILSTGTIKKVKFNSESACQTVQKEIMMSTLPKLQTAKCVKDPKK